MPRDARAPMLLRFLLLAVIAAPAAAATPALAQPAGQQAALADGAEAAEREAWGAALAEDSAAAYRGFLAAYPASRFAERATDRLATLEQAAETAVRVAGYRDLEASLGLSLASVATLESRLAGLGLTPGPADGRVDIETRRSIARFQAQAGLTPTGYLDPATIQRLLVAGN